MSDSIQGTLRVSNRVILDTVGGPVFVIVHPIFIAIGWDEIIRQSVETLLPWDGQEVTLEGDLLLGWFMASVRVVENAGPPQSGTYRGRIDSGVSSLDVELRVDMDGLIASADFFSQGNFRASLRTRLQEAPGSLEGVAPRVMFEGDDSSSLGGSLTLRPTGGGVFEVDCVLPEAVPTAYSGSTTFASEHFRTLNIEVDKLQGMPWPPELSTTSIPSANQPSGLAAEDLSIETLFGKAGIDARITHSEGSLDDAIGGNAGRPGEDDRWDEREMHEMMSGHYGRNLSSREWWLYLLIVTRFDGGPMYDYDAGKFVLDAQGNIRNDGEGTMGIIFDHTTGAVADPWGEWLPRILPQFRYLFDFGRSGAFENARARQGVAVFWREFLDYHPNTPAWDRDRRFLRTIVHELGHALNLAHAWLVNRADSTSFMQYPQRYPHGSTFDERDLNYWRDFDYTFDPEEIFHFAHGFYNEVIPGGGRGFMDWAPSSVFNDPTAGGTRANLEISIRPGAREYRFMEPVTLDVEVRNTGHDPVPVGGLSPSNGNVRYLVSRPDNRVHEYRAPVHKCEASKAEVTSDQPLRHTASLTVGSGGMTFDVPGRYEITAVLPDSSTGAVVVSRPVSIWVRYPTQDDEKVAALAFEREASLFLYLGGGEHLASGKNAIAEIAAAHSDHPLATHANLVLGLNAYAGQKSLTAKHATQSDLKGAEKYFEAAYSSKRLPKSLMGRLARTMELCNVDATPKRKSPKKK